MCIQEDFMSLRALICLLLLPLGVEAIEVYKCTDPQGHVSFGQVPCPSGSQSQVQDIQPIDTIEAQPANPADLLYLEDFSRRKAQEREEQRKVQEQQRMEANRARRRAEAQATAERRHQETLDAIRSRENSWRHYPGGGFRPWRQSGHGVRW